jgi:hypothetical protein
MDVVESYDQGDMDVGGKGRRKIGWGGGVTGCALRGSKIKRGGGGRVMQANRNRSKQPSQGTREKAGRCSRVFTASSRK